MSKPIVQSVVFSASAPELYDMFIDPKRHAAFTGGKVKISARPGSAFSAFNGLLAGQTLTTIPDHLIVQRWRSTQWRNSDPDSILVLTFRTVGPTGGKKGGQEGRGRIDLVHINVPEHDHAGVTRGWKKYYWTPLKAYLTRSPRN